MELLNSQPPSDCNLIGTLPSLKILSNIFTTSEPVLVFSGNAQAYFDKMSMHVNIYL